MPQTSILRKDEIIEHNRMDAEFYQPKYLNLERKILQTGSCKLWEHIDGQFITGPFGSEFKVENYVTDGIHRYVRGKDVKDFFLLDEDNVYIPKKDFERLNKYALKEGDILVSVVGTLGNTAVIDKSVLPAIFSCKSTVFRAKTMNPFYLITYLNCRFGKTLLQRKVRGTVQTGLNIDDLKSLPIFLPDKDIRNNVAKILLDAREHYSISKSLYSQAESMLLKELGLENFKLKYKLSYTANLSRATEVHRIDAEYFQPVYDSLEKHLATRFSAQPIGKLDFIDVTTGQYCKNYVEKSEGKPYIRGTDIKNGTISTDDLVYIAPQDQDKSKKAREGDVVVTRVGTIGLSARIPKECVGGTISDNLIRLRFDEKKLNSYYVALFLGSPIGASLMTKNSRGSVQQRLNQETLKYVVIPNLSNKIQQKIASLVRQSHEARMNVKELLEDAKKKVEEAIEDT